MRTKKTGIFLFVFFFSSISLFSQEEIGKIFTNIEADSLYGSVIDSYIMNTDSLIMLLNETHQKAMFSLKDNNFLIAGDSRKIIFPAEAKISAEMEMRVLSKIKVLELIAKGRKDQVVFENRKAVFSVSNGEFTLELSWPCPPYCD
ncbi:MAG: hypothetical protein CVV23_11965 [Ignavibacteriae bacterium HGW-Ignavibacteriae-2]|jgi:hypothetical protein|nr:hypothetical protein [Bacteroidota bacterium]PKL88102.1 MAG: hypothetical protein CVV23_11965 [Ignavibacteriae bacterium HGW-Ignavibacteriae-2]